MKRKKQIKPFQLYAIRVLQISGISLITVGVLNLIFIKYIGLLINFMLLLWGFYQLWTSYRLWVFLHRRLLHATGAKFTTQIRIKQGASPQYLSR